MSIQSEGAIKRCMKFLHIDPAAKETTRVDATIEVRKYNKRGPIGVEFHASAEDGPYISIDHTIRGYGVRQDEFKPGLVRMRFDAREGILHVSHEDDYDFVLKFATGSSG
jgi:hypothetical protein